MATEADIAELDDLRQSQAYTASAAVVLSAICLFLFAFAVFFLVKMNTRLSRLFLALAVLLELFALSQALLDMALAIISSRMVNTLLDGGSKAVVLSMQHKHVRVSLARQALLAINNTITDGLFVSLYRCAVIWAPSPYSKVVVAIPSVLILCTAVVGLYGTFSNGINSPWVPYFLALLTNFFLLALTAGRIWSKSRNATLALGAKASHRYNKILEILCESSFLYFIHVLVYMIAILTVPILTPLPSLVWGSMAQIVNIVPMMVMLRVGMARDSSRQDEARTSHGGDTSSYGMAHESKEQYPRTEC
ncbi:hypothetical protein DFH08DRAFT_211360 [Mycena albidolilacea]|uniref:Uncharacterized protein n=1 Tax=Mycena albidolilacea TaxID=1033008 RepID=A0AAD6ZZ43_9AGAR|nr:hypothetical protein DFH08DRAFT_211360 [Mycena albidolilacea]